MNLFDTLVQGTKTFACLLLLGLALPGVTQGQGTNCATAPAGLVSWWAGEGNANDQVNGNSGTVSGGVMYGTGKVGQGFVFNTTNGSVRIPASPNLNVGAGDGLTLETWINPQKLDYAPIADWNNGNDWGAHLFILKNGNEGALFVNLRDTSGNAQTVMSAGGLITTNAWQHVAVTYDKASGVVMLYRNGVTVGSGNIGSLTPQTSYDLYIGRRPAPAADVGYFLGMIDEMALYSRALAANEIAAIFGAGAAGKCRTVMPPIAPVINSQPVDVTTTAGSTVTFAVQAAGTGPLSYQWRWNRTNLAGYTQSSLVIPNVQASQAGVYSVQVSNSAGVVVSSDAALTVNTLPSGPCIVPPAGLVGWWAGEGNANDSVNGINGSISGGVTYGPGKVGDGFVFNTTNGSVRIAASSNLNVGAAGGGLTIETWINPQKLFYVPIAEWNNGSTWGTHFFILDNGTPGALFVNLRDTNGNPHMVTSAGGLITTNEWQHVAVTYDRTSGAVVLYRNGVQVGSGNIFSLIPQTSYDFYIGRRPAPAADAAYFLGMIDEMSLYSRALASNEITAIFAAGAAGKCQTVGPPTAPEITSQPMDTRITSGNTVTFALQATGTGPLFYQWQFNGTNLTDGLRINGASASTLFLHNLQLADSGIYTVIVSNAYGSVISSNAVLTVNNPPAVGISSPANGATFEAPSDILVSADVLDTDGTATKVEFYTQAALSNTQPVLLGSLNNSSPGIFSAQVVWPNVAAGNYVLSAIATDNNGAVGTSAPVAITVYSAPPLIILSTPLDSALYSPGADIPITATAADPDGSVVRVEFFAGTNCLGAVTRRPFSLTWSNVPAGSYTLTGKAIDDSGASSFSSAVNINVGPISTAPIFRFERAGYQVSEGGGSVTITVLKNMSIPASVNYASSDGSGSGPSTRYAPVAGRLDFAAGQLSANIVIPIYDDAQLQGDETFTIALSLPTNGGSLAEPSTASVTILDNDATLNSALDIVPPAPVPPALGSLRVDVEPPEALGQWRLAWESVWHDSGTTLVGLPTGNYELNFSPVEGYLQPPAALVPVGTNGLVEESFYYTPAGIPQLGALSINIEPNDVATNQDLAYRGQWHRQGESGWHSSGEILTNLNAGVYTVQFKPVPGRVKPADLQVWVMPELVNIMDATYLIGTPMGGDAIVPHPLTFPQITQSYSAQLPYAFNGQIRTDVGWGSGCVVKDRVVLTAAHLLFNDASLNYVTGVWWFFQRQAGIYEPLPQTPRGWYVFSGYAAQRTNDNSPGIDSPVAQNFDVAAMYFLEPAGRGGYGGYLVSEPSGTEWLLQGAQKILVGYPVDCVNECVPGEMHASDPANVGLNTYFGRVFNTANVRSFPGNSGGPLCVQHTNGYYYPAAIYLGGSGETVVRAIDGSVADLINRAEIAGHGGENSVGGGVVTVVSAFSGNHFCSGWVEVHLAPSSAVNAGGAWRVSPKYPPYSAYTNFTAQVLRIPVQNGSFGIEFANVPGFVAPTNTTVEISCNQGVAIYPAYKVLPPSLRWAPNTFSISGTRGTSYRLDYTDSLSQTAKWTPVISATLTNSSSPVSGITATNRGNRFYRTVWLP